MPQRARREVCLPAVGIDDRAALILGHRIDGEVAAPEILLECHRRCELGGETAVAGVDLALQPRERVLLVRFGVEEHRELPAHRW